MQPTLELEDVSVYYGKRRALEGVSLRLGEGEIVTLLGANGAGKSTTLRAVSGLVRPLRGRVLYDGRDITGWAADAIVAAGIGHVPEGRDLFPEFTVLDNLLVGGHTVARRELAARLELGFELFPLLRERKRQRAGTLSGGEQQMLAMARALVSRPRVLLLDEPSLGLAPMLTREIFRVIRRINERGVSVLLVEQNARRALGVADRGYVLETGRLVVSGPSRELLEDQRVRTAYLGLRPPGAGADQGE
ncbi:MAG: ABC transporter ATP-binding protein [Candidatus Rokubacteria bacterium GWC2_70_16]|nr:MAG: ABC transporter ATP-binding protein [Candidatus Rokubacteria bacterium GWC2_70_16]OGL18561.1 MAG: ABC transporter ATP-binding protein [Candidatus Rokubacteria bacterium RIFCSPLOWO2_12_FULL_71_19]